MIIRLVVIYDTVYTFRDESRFVKREVEVSKYVGVFTCSVAHFKMQSMSLLEV